MDKQIYKVIFISFLLIITGSWSLISAEYINLTELLKDKNIILEWDSLTQVGHLISGETEISFKLDLPFFLVNYIKKVTIEPIIRQKGALMFPESTYKKIKEIFAEEVAALQTLKEVAAIILDPGHGGKDPGAVTDEPSLYEKDVVLKVSLILEQMLKNQFPAKRIILTRADDTFIKLEERAKIANNIEIDAKDAILFISLHTNSGFNKQTKGFEVWHLPATIRRDLIGQEEAQPDKKEIIPILNTMLEEEYFIESVKLANYILKQLENQVGDVSENRGLKEEAWSVVRNSNMPSLLIELGFLSNKDEATRLSTESYLNKLATGIYNGIVEFITSFESTKGFTE